MISITYPGLPPKEFSRNSRAHWSALARAQDQASDDIYALLIEQGWRPSEPYKKARVSLTFVLPDRHVRDADNLITSAKPLMDALVTHHVISDDSIQCIGFPSYRYKYSRRKEALTVIKIEEVKKPDDSVE